MTFDDFLNFALGLGPLYIQIFYFITWDNFLSIPIVQQIGYII